VLENIRKLQKKRSKFQKEIAREEKQLSKLECGREDKIAVLSIKGQESIFNDREMKAFNRQIASCKERLKDLNTAINAINKAILEEVKEWKVALGEKLNGITEQKSQIHKNLYNDYLLKKTELKAMGREVDTLKTDSLRAMRLSLSFPSRWSVEKLLRVIEGDFTDCSPNLADAMNLTDEYEQYEAEKRDKNANRISECCLMNPESRNNRSYSPKAISSVKRLSEGIKSFLDHGDGLTGPSVTKLIGSFQNVKERNGALFADLHILRESPGRNLIMDIAENAPHLAGFSIGFRGHASHHFRGL
jgi:hypothetical protein